MTVPRAVELGRFEQALLQAARAEVAPRDALRKSAAALGVSLPAVGVAAFELTFTTGAVQATGATGSLAAATTEAATVGLAGSAQAGAALATSSAGAAGVAGAATAAAQPIATATLALLAKHVGAGVVAGAVFAGGAHQAVKVFDASEGHRGETAAIVQAQPARTVPRARGLAGVRRGALPLAELTRSATASSPSAVMPPVGDDAASLLRGGSLSAPVIGSPDTDRTEAAAIDAEAAKPADPNVPANNVAAFPTEPSAEAKQKTKVHAMPEPIGLELERLLIGRAQRALARGRPLMALRDLGLYAVKCRGGQLSAEANLLRVEALLRTDQRDKALDLARREIERHSTRAMVERVRDLFQAQGEPTNKAADAGESSRAIEKK